MVMSIVAASAWFVLCSANALLDATVADDMRGRGRLGAYWSHMLSAIVWMGLGVAYSVIVIGTGYGFGQWTATTWAALTLAALLLPEARLCETGVFDHDGDPEHDCMEQYDSHMRRCGHGFNMGLSLVLTCLLFAQAQGALSELSPNWWNAVCSRYPERIVQC